MLSASRGSSCLVGGCSPSTQTPSSASWAIRSFTLLVPLWRLLLPPPPRSVHGQAPVLNAFLHWHYSSPCRPILPPPDRRLRQAYHRSPARCRQPPLLPRSLRRRPLWLFLRHSAPRSRSLRPHHRSPRRRRRRLRSVPTMVVTLLRVEPGMADGARAWCGGRRPSGLRMGRRPSGWPSGKARS